MALNLLAWLFETPGRRGRIAFRGLLESLRVFAGNLEHISGRRVDFKGVKPSVRNVVLCAGDFEDIEFARPRRLDKHFGGDFLHLDFPPHHLSDCPGNVLNREKMRAGGTIAFAVVLIRVHQAADDYLRHVFIGRGSVFKFAAEGIGIDAKLRGSGQEHKERLRKGSGIDNGVAHAGNHRKQVLDQP